MFSASNLCLYQIISVINSHSIQCKRIACFSLVTFIAESILTPF